MRASRKSEAGVKRGYNLMPFDTCCLSHRCHCSLRKDHSQAPLSPPDSKPADTGLELYPPGISTRQERVRLVPMLNREGSGTPCPGWAWCAGQRDTPCPLTHSPHDAHCQVTARPPEQADEGGPLHFSAPGTSSQCPPPPLPHPYPHRRAPSASFLLDPS